MTSAPVMPPPQQMQRPAAPAPAPSAAPTMAAIDPVKLLNKYKWALLASAIVGGVLGIAAHFVLLKVAPVWRPTAQFRCYPQKVGTGVGDSVNATNADEMRTFMATESRNMTGDSVLDRLAKNPQLPSQAPNWSRQFLETGGDGVQRFNHLKAFEALKELAKARVIPNTTVIELSVSWRERDDATSILRLLQDTYIQTITESTRSLSKESVDALTATLNRLETEINGLTQQRANLLAQSGNTGNETSILSLEGAQIQDLTRDASQLRNDYTAITQEIAGMRERAGGSEGGKYTDDMRMEADRDPGVLEARSALQTVERARQSLIDRGFEPNHRIIRSYDSQIAAARVALEAAQADALDRTFKARLGRLESERRSLQEQVTQKEADIEARSKRLNDVRRQDSEILDLGQRIALLEARRAKTADDLSNFQTVQSMDSSKRVLVQQPAQPPNRLSFPKIELLFLAGVVFTVLLTGGTLFVRELVDQRVKSPADIGIIPRTRLLGWIPDAAEDLESGGATETAFRDRGRGVLAESFRQIRGVLLKRAYQTGHKTIVIMAGLPGSGATSVACNMALATAAADRRVLLIDANLRRPAINRVFGLGEAPGLADVLAKQTSLEHAIQNTSSPLLDVLSAGSRDLRIVERLSTDAMSDVLTQAKGLYDLVLLDVAPAIVGGDGTALASRCDASILVVKAFGEKRGMVARIKNELMETRGEFLGVIVNAVRAATGGYLKGNIKTAAEYQKAE